MKYSLCLLVVCLVAVTADLIHDNDQGQGACYVRWGSWGCQTGWKEVLQGRTGGLESWIGDVSRAINFNNLECVDNDAASLNSNTGYHLRFMFAESHGTGMQKVANKCSICCPDANGRRGTYTAFGTKTCASGYKTGYKGYAGGMEAARLLSPSGRTLCIDEKSESRYTWGGGEGPRLFRHKEQPGGDLNNMDQVDSGCAVCVDADAAGASCFTKWGKQTCDLAGFATVLKGRPGGLQAYTDSVRHMFSNVQCVDTDAAVKASHGTEYAMRLISSQAGQNGGAVKKISECAICCPSLVGSWGSFTSYGKDTCPGGYFPAVKGRAGGMEMFSGKSIYAKTLCVSGENAGKLTYTGTKLYRARHHPPDNHNGMDELDAVCAICVDPWGSDCHMTWGSNKCNVRVSGTHETVFSGRPGGLKAFGTGIGWGNVECVDDSAKSLLSISTAINKNRLTQSNPFNYGVSHIRNRCSKCCPKRSSRMGVYTVWGRDTCYRKADQVMYKGRAGGMEIHKGSIFMKTLCVDTGGSLKTWSSGYDTYFWRSIDQGRDMEGMDRIDSRCAVCAEDVNIDACIAYPCDDNAGCIDKKAPALNLPEGRTCTCKPDYTGTGEPGQCCPKYQELVNKKCQWIVCHSNCYTCTSRKADGCERCKRHAELTSKDSPATCKCSSGYGGSVNNCRLQIVAAYLEPVVGGSSVTVRWSSYVGAAKYEVKFGKANGKDVETKTTTKNFQQFTNLNPKTEYSYSFKVILTSEWAKLKISTEHQKSQNVRTNCRCTEVMESQYSSDKTEGGAPTRLQIIQDHDDVLAQFQDTSLCEDKFVAARDSVTLETEAFDKKQIACIDDLYPANPAPFDGLTTGNLDLNKGYQYEFFAIGDGNYQSQGSKAPVFTPDWIATVNVDVRTRRGVHMTSVPIRIEVVGLPASSVTKGFQGQTGETTAAVMKLQASGLKNLRQKIRVYPEKAGHTYVCSDPSNSPEPCTYLELDVDFKGNYKVELYDTSTFSVQGTVLYEGLCGVQGVEVCLDELSPRQTTNDPCVHPDKNGLYTLDVAVSTKVRITPRKEGYTFEPASYVLEDITGELQRNFEITTKTKLQVDVVGGACDLNIGGAKVIVKSPECLGWAGEEYDLTTTTLTKSMFAINVTVTLKQVTTYSDGHGLKGGYFRGGLDKKTFDLSTTNITHLAKWAYHTRSSIQFNKELSQPSQPCLNATTSVKVHNVVKQGVPVGVTFDIYEDYGKYGRCDVVPAKYTVIDDMTTTDQSTVYHNMTNTTMVKGKPATLVVYEVLPEGPYLKPPFTRKLKLDVERVGDSAQKTSETFEAVVTGFHNVGPEQFSTSLPKSSSVLITLRHPPGDRSSASITKGTSFERTFTTVSGTQRTDHFDMMLFVGTKGDAEMCTGIGVALCATTVEHESKVGAGYEHEKQVNDLTDSSFTVSYTAQETFTTSTLDDILDFAENAYLGDRADYVYVPSILVLYRPTFQLLYDFETCSVPKISKVVTFQPKINEKLDSHAWYPLGHIEDNVIPGLKSQIANKTLRAELDLATDEEFDVSRISNYSDYLLWQDISNWQQIIDNHRNNSVNSIDALIPTFDPQYTPPVSAELGGIKAQRIQFGGGGGSYTYTYGYESAAEVTRDNHIELDHKVFASGELDMTFVTIRAGVESHSFGNFKSVSGGSDSTKTTQSSEVSYTLGDVDTGDEFAVLVTRDPVYGGPVFKTEGGSSSCPAEPGTQPRQTFTYKIQGNTDLKNMPPDSLVVLNVTVEDQSWLTERDQGYSYTMVIEPDLKTQNGLILELNGVPFRRTEFFMTRKEVISFPVTARIGVTGSVYKDVSINIYPECDDGLGQQRDFSVQFIDECPKVEWSGDVLSFMQNKNPWVVNSKSGGRMELKLRNPAFSRPWKSVDILTNVTVEYRRKDQNNWFTIKDVKNDEDDLGYVVFNWKVPSGQGSDADYVLRARSQCKRSVSADFESFKTLEVAGSIDTTAPIVFGKPEPADKEFKLGDKISITFNEPLKCVKSRTYRFEAAIVGTEYIARLVQVCEGRNLLFAFHATSNYESIMGKTLMVSFVDTLGAGEWKVQDTFGNPVEKISPWTFVVEQLPAETLTVTLTNLKSDLTLEQGTLKSEIAKLLSISAERLVVKVTTLSDDSSVVDLDIKPPAPTTGRRLLATDTACSLSAVLTSAVTNSNRTDEFSVSYPSLSSLIIDDDATQQVQLPAAAPAAPTTAVTSTAFPTPVTWWVGVVSLVSCVLSL